MPATNVTGEDRPNYKGQVVFASLYERYRDQVYAYLRTRTQSVEDAADLTQQVFLRALDALPQYRGHREGLAPWLFRIAHNSAVDFHRRQHITVSWDLVPETLHPLANEDVEAGVLHHEAVVRLRILLGQLDQETREMLVLRFAAQLTVAETAAVLGKSEATVKKRLLRIIHRLKDQYNEPTTSALF